MTRLASPQQVIEEINTKLQAVSKKTQEAQKLAKKKPDKAKKAMQDAEKLIAQAEKTLKSQGKDLPKPILKELEQTTKRFKDFSKQSKNGAPDESKLKDLNKNLLKTQQNLKSQAKKL